MKILIVNQHTQNHGDEAAGLALIRKLYENGYKDITVLYNITYLEDIKTDYKRCFHLYKNVKHVLQKRNIRGIDRAVILYVENPNILTKYIGLIFSGLRREYKLIKKSEYVISAPGGASFGMHKSYRNLWRLMIAKNEKRKYAIYSPSIGPFENNDLFKNQVKNILFDADYLSLRDKKSYQFADELNVKYIKSIDSAYLDTVVDKPPENIIEILPEKYIVIVPNQLYNWHFKYKDIDQNKVDGFYKKLIIRFVEKGVNVVLLPQLYCQGNNNDESYFESLRKELNGVIVVPTDYNSDIQQYVISNSEFVVGARYHTIVFAINNAKPFCSLSYEYKISEMIKLLDLTDNNIDINYAFDNQENSIKKIYQMYEERDLNIPILKKAQYTAKNIAKMTFEEFSRKIM